MKFTPFFCRCSLQGKEWNGKKGDCIPVQLPSGAQDARCAVIWNALQRTKKKPSRDPMCEQTQICISIYHRFLDIKLISFSVCGTASRVAPVRLSIAMTLKCDSYLFWRGGGHSLRQRMAKPIQRGIDLHSVQLSRGGCVSRCQDAITDNEWPREGGGGVEEKRTLRQWINNNTPVREGASQQAGEMIYLILHGFGLFAF